MNRARPATKPHAVDRLAARYQQARLHTRALHGRVAAAVVAGDVRGLLEAMPRLRAAAAWEARARRRYECAALLEHAPMPLEAAVAAPGAGATSAA